MLSFQAGEGGGEAGRKIDRLYHYFERLGDRAGQHEMMALALKGLNRARFSGKEKEGLEFLRWLWVTSLTLFLYVNKFLRTHSPPYSCRAKTIESITSYFFSSSGCSAS